MTRFQLQILQYVYAYTEVTVYDITTRFGYNDRTMSSVHSLEQGGFLKREEYNAQGWLSLSETGREVLEKNVKA